MQAWTFHFPNILIWFLKTNRFFFFKQSCSCHYFLLHLLFDPPSVGSNESRLLRCHGKNFSFLSDSIVQAPGWKHMKKEPVILKSHGIDPPLTSADKHYHALNPDEVQAHTWIGHSSSSFCIKDCIADCCTAVQNSTFCSGAAADPQRSDSTTRAPVCASQGARMFSRQEPLTQQTKRGR